ncbi:MAG: signal peptidase I [Bacteroidales bacterium]
MTKKKNNIDKPVEFYKEKDVFGLQKTASEKLAESLQNNVVKTVNSIKTVKRPKRKKPWVASFLSLFSLGLGHVYAGKIKKGVIIYLGFILIVLSVRFLAFSFYVFVGLIAVIVAYYLYTIFDAFLSVKRNPDAAPKKYDKWFVYLAIIILQAVLFEFVPKGILNKITPIITIYIPSTSMSPTLQIGDYGTIERTKDIKLNDIVVFKYPQDTATLFIFRCAAMPGDNLEIINGLTYVNKKMIDNSEKLKYQYFITTNGEPLNQSVFDKYGITDQYQMDDSSYQIFLTEKEANEFKKISIVKDINKITGNRVSTLMLFPESDTIWTVDNYGPMYIPQKGKEIKLSRMNIGIYASLIKQENKNCIIADSLVQIDNKVITDYMFKKNYYFVLGDNRHNALDSRYWGFVPEDYILGKGLYLYWSKKSDRIGLRIE